MYTFRKKEALHTNLAAVIREKLFPRNKILDTAGKERGCTGRNIQVDKIRKHTIRPRNRELLLEPFFTYTVSDLGKS